MDDRKRFGAFSSHSVNCLVKWQEASIRDIKESSERGCPRCGIHIEAILKCALPDWLTQPGLVINCDTGAHSPSIRLTNHTTYAETIIQFFTSDGNVTLGGLPFVDRD